MLITVANISLTDYGSTATVDLPGIRYTGDLLRASKPMKDGRRFLHLRTEAGLFIDVAVSMRLAVNLEPLPVIEVGDAVARRGYWDPTSPWYRLASFGVVTNIGKDSQKRVVYFVVFEPGPDSSWLTRRAIRPLTPEIISDPGQIPMLLDSRKEQTQ